MLYPSTSEETFSIGEEVLAKCGDAFYRSIVISIMSIGKNEKSVQIILTMVQNFGSFGYIIFDYNIFEVKNNPNCLRSVRSTLDRPQQGSESIKSKLPNQKGEENTIILKF